MTAIAYSPPVNQLLTYGDCRKLKQGLQWPNYVEALQLTAEHIPELLRMVTDETLWSADAEQPECWAPIHAWRSLGQLRAEAAISPLINLFDNQDDDWITEELPKVFRLIGPVATQPLAEYILDGSKDDWGRISAVDCLEAIGKAYPEAQEACVTALITSLKAFGDNAAWLNGRLTSGLITFQVREAAPLIEQVYADGRIDEMFAGSWPGVQVALGLKSRADFSPEELKPKMPEDLKQLGETLRALENDLPAIQAGEHEQFSKFGQGSLRLTQQKSPKASQGFGQTTSTHRKKRKKKHK